MDQRPSPGLCIYCSNPIGRIKKGEHIIPKAIGGARTIKTVCGDCNNKFSGIDEELCSRSYLSIVASQKIDSHIRQAWDVDAASGNLLIEGKPQWAERSFIAFPQMIFEKSGPQIRTDHQEVLSFGRDNFEQVFVRAVRQAFGRYKAGKKRVLHFERIELPHELKDGYRFPPRIFWRHSIRELASRLSSGKTTPFVLRYQHDDSERRVALNCLDNWNLPRGFNGYSVEFGCERPSFRCICDPTKVLRALTKIALNMLAAFCPNTPVCKSCFSDVIEVVTGDAPVPPGLIRRCGFVWASDIQPIADKGGGHSFRLLYMNPDWHVFASFFGGQIGSFIRFPGPNNEDWSSADIIAPLHSQDWTFSPSHILQPLTVRVEWEDLTKVMPSDQICNTKTELKVTRSR